MIGIMPSMIVTSFSSGADDEALTTGESKQTNFSHIFKSIMNGQYAVDQHGITSLLFSLNMV